MSRARQKPRMRKSGFRGGMSIWVVVAFLMGLGMIQGGDRILRIIMPIRHVRIGGEFANLDPQEIEHQLLPLVGGNYITVDLGEIEKAASSLAWVSSLSVMRVWPDTIQIDVAEYTAVARWDSLLMLSETGKVFRASGSESNFYHLPMVHAPQGYEVEALKMLHGLNEKLIPWGTSVGSIRLNDRLAWRMELSDGLEISIGNQDPLKAMDRLLSVLPSLGEQRLALLKKVDLRYPRGFAVTWKSPSVEDAVPPSEQGHSKKPASGVKKT